VRHLGHRLSALVDGELGAAQRDRALAHLARCEACRREAAALRALKRRMHALGEATAGTALTDRLMAMGARRPAPAAAGPGRRRWPVRSLAAAGLAVAGLGLPAAAFLAGGAQQRPGPAVTPAIDLFTVQHEISTGSAPAGPTASPTATASPRPARPRHHHRASLTGAR
jgi:anti-sigma factor RsiW